MSVTQHIFKISQFKSRPEDIPYSVNLLIVLFVSHMLIKCVGFHPISEKLMELTFQDNLASAPDINIIKTIFFYIMSSSLSLLLLNECLKFVKKQGRFIQCASNYIGARALIDTINGVTIGLFIFSGFNLLGCLLTSISCFIWLAVTETYIIRETFETSNLRAFGIVFLISFVPSTILQLLAILFYTG